jgi:hypothetical protein
MLSSREGIITDPDQDSIEVVIAVLQHQGSDIPVKNDKVRGRAELDGATKEPVVRRAAANSVMDKPRPYDSQPGAREFTVEPNDKREEELDLVPVRVSRQAGIPQLDAQVLRRAQRQDDGFVRDAAVPLDVLDRPLDVIGGSRHVVYQARRAKIDILSEPEPELVIPQRASEGVQKRDLLHDGNALLRILERPARKACTPEKRLDRKPLCLRVSSSGPGEAAGGGVQLNLGRQGCAATRPRRLLLRADLSEYFLASRWFVPMRDHHGSGRCRCTGCMFTGNRLQVLVLRRLDLCRSDLERLGECRSSISQAPLHRSIG